MSCSSYICNVHNKIEVCNVHTFLICTKVVKVNELLWDCMHVHICMHMQLQKKA